jgi:hypothetical protein
MVFGARFLQVLEGNRPKGELYGDAKLVRGERSTGPVVDQAAAGRWCFSTSAARHGLGHPVAPPEIVSSLANP